MDYQYNEILHFPDWDSLFNSANCIFASQKLGVFLKKRERAFALVLANVNTMLFARSLAMLVARRYGILVQVFHLLRVAHFDTSSRTVVFAQLDIQVSLALLDACLVLYSFAAKNSLLKKHLCTPNDTNLKGGF